MWTCGVPLVIHTAHYASCFLMKQSSALLINMSPCSRQLTWGYILLGYTQYLTTDQQNIRPVKINRCFFSQNVGMLWGICSPSVEIRKHYLHMYISSYSHFRAKFRTDAADLRCAGTFCLGVNFIRSTISKPRTCLKENGGKNAISLLTWPE